MEHTFNAMSFASFWEAYELSTRVFKGRVWDGEPVALLLILELCDLAW